MIYGVWEPPIKYVMTDARTGKTKLIIIPGADDPTIVEPEERDDIVADYSEKFEEELKGAPDHVSMSKSWQHDLGNVLFEIRESQQRRQEVGHGRYW